MRLARYNLTLLSVLLSLTIIGSASAEPSGKNDYVVDCARCHGAEGKGSVEAMKAVRGYISVDLTQLSKANGGQFPRQEVYDAIDGRKRFRAHFVGDMPTWGLKYRQDKRRLSQEEEEKIRLRISALVDYIQTLQER